MSKFDKYFDDFNPPEGTGGESHASGLTAEDLQAVESRINRYIDESIKRLDEKLDTINNASEGGNENESEE